MHAPLYEENNKLDVIVDYKENTEYDDWTHSMYCNWIDKQGV